MPDAPEITDAEFDAGKFFSPLQKKALAYFAAHRDPQSLDRLAKALGAPAAGLKEELAELEEIGLIETKLIDGRDFYRGKPGPA